MNFHTICIGMRLQDSPWGGGNAAIGALSRHLISKGITVSHDLDLPKADIILLTDPRLSLASCSFNHRHITKYLIKNPHSIVVHRINECDERKGTTDLNKRIIRSNRCADHTVFVGSWLKELYRKQGLASEFCSVILNGSDSTLFDRGKYKPWNRANPLKIVTHHWGTNWLKGFDIYQRLDRKLGEEPFKHKIEFTYIGNIPNDITFSNTTVLPPMTGKQLADTIASHHIYLTASRNEPGGNHQNEGACSGLPILFIHSGCLPEYCHGYGVSFTPETFDEKLIEVIENYDYWASKMHDFPNTAKRMCDEYVTLFNNLTENRNSRLRGRRLWKHPFWVAGTLAGLL